MRKCILAGSFLALVASAVPAAAQSLPPDPGTWVISLGGGVTIPIGTQGKESDNLKTGVHGAVTVGYQLPDTHTLFGMEVLYLRAGNKTTPDDHSNVLTFMAHTHFALGPAYLVLGAGLLRNEYRQPLSNIVITNTHAGFAVEGGLGVEFGKVVFVEGRVLHSFRGDKDRYTLVPLTLGIRF